MYKIANKFFHCMLLLNNLQPTEVDHMTTVKIGKLS